MHQATSWAASWHDDVRGLDRVDSLLDHIAARAVSELGVGVAVASARAAGGRAGPLVARARGAEHPVKPARALAPGGRVVAPPLPVRAWWPATARGRAPPRSALLVDLSGGVGEDASAGGPRLDLEAGVAEFFGPPELRAAARFAAYASLSLLAVERVANLGAALETRAVISQAQGILMERFGLGPDAAMNLLRRWSQASHRRVHDLALGITLEGPPRPDAEPGEQPSWTP